MIIVRLQGFVEFTDAVTVRAPLPSMVVSRLVSVCAAETMHVVLMEPESQTLVAITVDELMKMLLATYM